MKREPVLLVSVLIACVIAVLQAAGAGAIDSADDVVSIVLPILGGLVARSQVTPVPARRR